MSTLVSIVLSPVFLGQLGGCAIFGFVSSVRSVNGRVSITPASTFGDREGSQP